MPVYNDLRPSSDYEKNDYALVFPQMQDAEKARTLKNLLRLKAGLADKIPSRKTDETLLVASWNIKEFGHTKQRISDSYFYLAEIISRFDLVAIQEVKSHIKDLHILMRLLGDGWKYIVNDITNGTDGNSERSAYLYNHQRVKFSGLAGELSLWPKITENSTIKQLKRSPYITGFEAGWKSFALLNLHLHPGDSDDDIELRSEEIQLLLKALAKKDKELWTQNLIICGDTNLYTNKDTAAVKMIADAGYVEVDGLIGKNTNAANTQAFDRLFIRRGELFSTTKDNNNKDKGDVFNPYDYIYRQDDMNEYIDDMNQVYGGDSDLTGDATARWRYYKQYWRANQISDHLPIWFELAIDSSTEFLQAKQKAFE